MGLEDRHAVQEQVAEVGGVQLDQAALVLGVERDALAVVGVRLGRRHAGGGEGAVLPVVDEPGQHPRRPALLVDVLGGDELLEQPQLVVGVEDGEARLQVQVAHADEFGVAAQDLDADRVEGAEPRHPLDRLAQKLRDPRLHLARGLVGEGHGEDAAGGGPALGQKMCDAGGQRAGLAGAGAGEQQDRAVQRLDRGALRGVQPVEIGGRRLRPDPHRPRAERRAGGGGTGSCGLEGVGVVELAHVANIGHSASQRKGGVHALFVSSAWAAPRVRHSE